MTKEVMVGAVQMNCVIADVNENVSKILAWLDKAGKKGLDIVCFPELCTTGYNPKLIKDKFYQLAEAIPGPSTDKIGKKASEYGFHVIAGINEKGENKHKIYNSAVLIGPDGQIIGKYRKVHLWTLEKKYFSSGSQYPVFKTPFGEIGIMICYDAGFPEVARTLSLAGAKMIFVPSAWRIEDTDIWLINTQARSLENTVYLVGVNRIGIEQDLHLFGRSRIVNPRGTVMTEGAQDLEMMIYSSVDLGLLSTFREMSPYLRDRRPETYNAVLQK